MDNQSEAQLLQHTEQQEKEDGLLDSMNKSQHLWGLMGTEGWVMIEYQDAACLPIWAAAEDALAWHASQTNQGMDAQAQQISLLDFSNQWLPGLEKNNILIGLSPVAVGDELFAVQAAELASQIRVIK
jgi:hypothetical protein